MPNDLAQIRADMEAAGSAAFDLLQASLGRKPARVDTIGRHPFACPADVTGAVAELGALATAARHTHDAIKTIVLLTVHNPDYKPLADDLVAGLSDCFATIEHRHALLAEKIARFESAA